MVRGRVFPGVTGEMEGFFSVRGKEAGGEASLLLHLGTFFILCFCFCFLFRLSMKKKNMEGIRGGVQKE